MWVVSVGAVIRSATMNKWNGVFYRNKFNQFVNMGISGFASNNRLESLNG